VHAIDGRATEVRGAIDVEIVEGRVARLGGGRIEVPVATLKSGNPLEDAELQRRIDARRYPAIAGEVRSADAVDEEGRFRVEGELTFHGVTQKVAGEVQASVDGERIVVEGEHVFDVREFGIKPPRILMLRVEPDVRVNIKLVAEAAPGG
jgi:polyisoprenoid-binding protein YceI